MSKVPFWRSDYPGKAVLFKAHVYPADDLIILACQRKYLRADLQPLIKGTVSLNSYLQVHEEPSYLLYSSLGW